MASLQEREMAARALAHEGSGPAPPFPPVAARIRAARQRLGISEAEVADRWGVQPSLYWDLELRDSELFTCVDFASLPRLAAALGTTPLALLFGEKPQTRPALLSYAEVSRRIAQRLSDHQVSIDQLSDSVGWDLGPVVHDPEALGTFNIAGVHDICRAVGVDWVELLG